MAGLFGGNAMKVFDQVLGGKTITEARDYLEEQAAAKARAAQMQQMIDQNVTDPRERMIAMANPKAWSDALAERLKPMQVTGGNTVLNGSAGSPYMAPKLVDNDGVYGVQGSDGYTQTGQRGQTHAELQTQVRDAASIDAEIQKLIAERERIKIAQGQLGVSRGQLGVSQAAHVARVKSGGYGTPGVGSILGNGAAPLGEGWEVQ